VRTAQYRSHSRLRRASIAVQGRATVLCARRWVVGESMLPTQSVRNELLNSLILHDNCIPTYFLCVPCAGLTAGTKRPYSATSEDTTPTDPPPKRVTFSTCEVPDSDSDPDTGPESLSERERSTARETYPAPPLTQEYTGFPAAPSTPPRWLTSSKIWAAFLSSCT
jgi:hypothetical protein